MASSDPLPPPEDANLPVYTDVDKVPLSLLEQLSGHWRAMSMAEKRRHDVSVKHIIWSQLLTIVIVGGLSYFLEANKQALLLAGSTLIIYPALNNLYSSNGTALAATLHHEFDAGVPLNRFRLVMDKFLLALAVSLLASLVVGVVGGLFGLLLFGDSFLLALVMACVAGLGTGIFGLPLCVATVFLIRHFSSNPDNVASPVANTVCNLLPLLFVVLVTRWLA
jgi:cation transporter-like permease